jgi:succinoglycan biosynthesis protein ExoM
LSSIETTYCIEAQQNIALARNKALAHAKGDFIAFIDDDEFPPETWLLTLFRNCSAYGVDGVLGPVKPHFDVPPPKWVIKGKFYARPTYKTGLIIDWRKGRTGNVLFRRRILDQIGEAFRAQFGSGAEDQDFFRRMIERGHVFIWCNEAVAYEVVPSLRWKRSFMLRRALLRGKMSLNHPTSGIGGIAKSMIAVPLYALALPFMLVLGHHRFMNCLIKLFDHGGKILACLNLNPVTEIYVTE